MVNVELNKFILWQYTQSPRLLALFNAKNRAYNELHNDFWKNWARDVFDLRTANEFGLAVWARILDIPLVFEGGRSPVGFRNWGLAVSSYGFQFGNFGVNSDTISTLTTEEKRLILRLAAFRMFSNGNIKQTNEFLQLLRDEKTTYPSNLALECNAIDGFGMAITYLFTRYPSSELLNYLIDNDLLPRPAGVRLQYRSSGLTNFAFGEHRGNFENANFGQV